jgi:E3 ubiquitin-protein ligase HUWE1
VTGTSKVPLEGFGKLQGMNGIQRFQIQRASGVDRLPAAHTCFNQLDLCEYSGLETSTLWAV